jgi:hypothetical protein
LNEINGSIQMTYGPVDFIALEFTSHKLRGEILPALLKLVNDRIVRVVDLIIIQKYEDDSHKAFELQQLDPALMAAFEPLEVQVSGIIQVEDIEAIAESMDPDTTSALLLVENLWALEFKEAVLRADGQLIAQERIPYDVLDEVLEVFADAEA